MANINKIKLSGTTYNIQDLNATKTVELTQAEYDALPTSAKTSNSLFVITDAEAGDLSNYYTKSETNGLLDTKLDVTAYTPTDLSNYYTKSETSGATEISTALTSKADTATTYTKTETDNAITAATSTKQDTLVSGTNIKTINNQSILGEGNITIQGGGGSSYTAGDGINITNDVISVTGKVDTSAFTAHTADTVIHVTSDEKAAWNDKQDALVSGTNIKTINGETLLGEGNITIQGGGSGGGKAISGGTNISITTGETADTINCTLPIYSGINLDGTAAGSESIRFSTNTYFGSSKGLRSIRGRYNSNALGEDSICFGVNSYVRGFCSFGVGRDFDSYGDYATIFGYGTNTKNLYETAIGKHNASNSGSTDADKTLFSVGNGTDGNARHNAFEIRQNGDIYIADTNDTSTTNYYEKPMIKLQDALGGGGSSYTAGDGINITNDVISVTGKVDTSAITTSISSSSTDAQVPSAKAVYDMVGNINTILESI